MDFLNHSFAYLTDLFKSMTLSARLTTAVLLMFIAVSLVYLFRHTGGGAEELFLGGRQFSAREIATMTGAFSQAGLSEWDDTGNRLRVPRGKRFQYMAALMENQALPDDFDMVFEEMFNAGNPFESRERQQLRFKWAKERELALVITNMTGIEKAKVTYDEVSKGGFSRGKEKRALAAARAVGNKHLTDQQVESIRSAVAASFAGLEPADVTVTDLNAGFSWPGRSSDGRPNLHDNLYAANQRIFERDLQEKIYHNLSMIPGVVVGVNVELNPEMNHRTNRQTYNQPQAVSIESRNSDRMQKGGTIGGRPGAVPNGVVSNAPTQVAASNETNSSTETETYEKQHSVVGTETTNVDKVPLMPTRVTASIRVPNSYFDKVWRKRNPTAAGEEPKEPVEADLRAVETETIQEIEKTVVGLLPSRPAGEDPYPQVVVTTYTETIEDDIKPPSTTDLATSWLAEHWQTLAMLSVGCFSLLFLRSMLRSGAGTIAADNADAEAQPPLQLADVPPEPSEEEDEEDRENSLRRRFQRTGPSLRDELTELVREDPDAAANVLSAWIEEEVT